MNKLVSKSQRQAVLREWKLSGKGARDFCEGRGLKEQQLYWWARSAEAKRGRTGRVRLVEAIPVDAKLAPCVPSELGPRWSWELAGPGAVLRGSDLDASTLLILMAAVTTAGRR